MAALRALAERSAGGRRVEGIAPGAVERGLAAFEIEAPVVAPVVPQPHAEEHHGDNRAVEDDGGGEIKHPQDMAAGAPDPQQKPSG